MDKNISTGDKYKPIIGITDQVEADIYFEECVKHRMSFDISRDEAVDIERSNIAYFAGYYDHETRVRVEKLFKCMHPVFGKAKNWCPTPEQAFRIGIKIGKLSK